MTPRSRPDPLITRWRELHDRGQEITVADLCQDCPDLLAEVEAALTWVQTRASEMPCPPRGPLAVPVAWKVEERGQIGRFRVIRLLGVGGMGSVYEAVDIDRGRSVAIKTLRSDLAGDRASHDRFLHEARIAAHLKHEHILRIEEVGEDDGLPYLVMPLLSGQSLESRLQREGRLPALEVARVGLDVAKGLAAAHRQGLIHRDIKPANLWLEGPRGRVRILDFGLATPVEEDTLLHSGGGTVTGTPAYVAPEQAMGGAVDTRADLFSLGCVLYRMITGRQPFTGRSTHDLLVALINDPPVPPRQLVPGVPPGLEALILRLMAKDPSARPSSAQAVVQEIEAAMGGRPPGAHPRISAKRGRKRLAVSVAGILVAGGLLLPRESLPMVPACAPDPAYHVQTKRHSRSARTAIRARLHVAPAGGKLISLDTELPVHRDRSSESTW